MGLGVALEGLRLVLLLTLVERLQVIVFVLALLLEEGAQFVVGDGDLVVAAQKGGEIIFLLLVLVLVVVERAIATGRGRERRTAATAGSSAATAEAAATAAEAAAGAGATAAGAGTTAGVLHLFLDLPSLIGDISLSLAHLSRRLTQARSETVLSLGDVLHHRGEVLDAEVRDCRVRKEHEAEGVLRHLVLCAGSNVLRALDRVRTGINLGRMGLKLGGVNREIVTHRHQRPSCSRRELI